MADLSQFLNGGGGGRLRTAQVVNGAILFPTNTINGTVIDVTPASDEFVIVTTYFAGSSESVATFIVNGANVGSIEFGLIDNTFVAGGFGQRVIARHTDSAARTVNFQYVIMKRI